MITTIAVIAAIAAIAGKKNDRYHSCDRWTFIFLSDRITAMVAIIWKPGFREPKKLQYPHFGLHMIATIAGKCFPYMIAMIAAITERFFSQRSQRS